MLTPQMSRARRRALLPTAAIAAIALSGCSVNSPTATDLRYAPADGVDVDAASFDARNLLVVSHGEGAPGVVVGSVVNTSSEPITVSVSVDGTAVEQQVEVAPHQQVRLDGMGGEDEGAGLILDAVEPGAGSWVEIRVQGGDDAVSANAPIMLPRGPYEAYADQAGGPVEDTEESTDGHEGHDH